MDGERGKPAPKGPLTAEHIGRYRGRVPARELAFIQLHAGRAMEALGYRRERLQLTPGQTLRFALADWPPNFARMLAWRAREAVLHRRATQGGDGGKGGPMRVRRGAASAD